MQCPNTSRYIKNVFPHKTKVFSHKAISIDQMRPETFEITLFRRSEAFKKRSFLPYSKQ